MKVDTRELVAHARWANDTLFEHLGQAQLGFLDTESRPGAPTNLELLRHMVGVERGFLDVLRGGPQRPNPPADLPAVVAYGRENAAGYAELTETWTDDDYEREVHVPWWDRSFTAAECLLQVLGHTGQHRAEIAWELARAGVSTGELDFIVWRAEVRQ